MEGYLETYSRIGLLRSYGNLQSYWTTKKLWKLTVVFDYYEAMELTVVLDYYEAMKLTVVLDHYEAMETYSRIGLLVKCNPKIWLWTNS